MDRATPKEVSFVLMSSKDCIGSYNREVLNAQKHYAAYFLIDGGIICTSKSDRRHLYKVYAGRNQSKEKTNEERKREDYEVQDKF